MAQWFSDSRDTTDVVNYSHTPVQCEYECVCIYRPAVVMCLPPLDDCSSIKKNKNRNNEIVIIPKI